ncbi:MAG: DUF2809 domain-containing protein [Ferruginibacter sp.]
MSVKRISYLLVFIFCTWLALATRSHPSWFHPIIVKYGGDTIWAGMFLFLLRVFFIKTALWKLALITFAAGTADELLQLYHAPWIESIRQTRLGGLLLGYGFLWSDIVCYGVGVIIAFLIITLVERKRV